MYRQADITEQTTVYLTNYLKLIAIHFEHSNMNSTSYDDTIELATIQTCNCGIIEKFLCKVPAINDVMNHFNPAKWRKRTVSTNLF